MQVDIDKLSDSDKRELQQSLNNEMQKAKIQECAPVPSLPLPPTFIPLHFDFPESRSSSPSRFQPGIPYLCVYRSANEPVSHLAVHELTDICWKKCVTGSISSSGLDRKEEPCIQNCVDRFLDANEAVLKHLSVMRGQGGM